MADELLCRRRVGDLRTLYASANACLAIESGVGSVEAAASPSADGALRTSGREVVHENAGGFHGRGSDALCRP
jgi:hypothetical protein